jgi:succinate dehydrogenase/fumarate reductase cytochrome b subunit
MINHIIRGIDIMENGLRKFYWGFFFIMLSFRIQGYDILPDVVGYVLFAIGFNSLSEKSDYFRVAYKFNLPLIVLSLFTIYQWPVQAQDGSSMLKVSFAILMSIVLFALNLYVVFNLFMGIRDIMDDKGNSDLVAETDERWNQYKILQIAAVCALIVAFIPVFNLLYIITIFIVSSVIAIKIMGFIKRCEQEFLM